MLYINCTDFGGIQMEPLEFEETARCQKADVHVDLWETSDVEVGISIPLNTSADDFPIEKDIEWINEKRQEICDFIISQGFVECAKEWSGISNISSDEFCKSLYFDSTRINYRGWEKGRPGRITLYLHCNPDYFSGHIVEVRIKIEGVLKTENTIKIFSECCLAG